MPNPGENFGGFNKWPAAVYHERGAAVAVAAAPRRVPGEAAVYTVLFLALAAQPKADDAPKLDPFVARAIEPAAADAPLRKLQKERVRERALALDAVRRAIAAGSADAAAYTDFVRLQVAIADNLAELMDEPADRVRCYEMRVEALKEYEKLVRARVDAGATSRTALHLAAADRLDAEIALLKVREARKGGK